MTVKSHRGRMPWMRISAAEVGGTAVGVWRDGEMWESVAAELRDHRRRGLGRVLTEDTVRFATARALVEAGADPAGLRVEWPHPVLTGSRVDLVAGGKPPEVVIEFKFPREPAEKNAAWTMALGEVLKDLYRLAACPGEPDRLFVYAETTRLRQYMARAAQRYGLDVHAERVVLRPADAAGLPRPPRGSSARNWRSVRSPHGGSAWSPSMTGCAWRCTW